MADLLEATREVPPGLAESERSFAAEPVDRTWAPATEAGLFAKLAEMPGLRVIDMRIECRSTMCRLELTEPRAAQAAADVRPFNILSDSVGLEPRWMIRFAEPSGPMKSIAYLWRQGFAPQQRPGEPHRTE